MRRHIEIFPQFLQRVSAQEEPVEECSFLLRFRELEVRGGHNSQIQKQF
jgi:hypothetical protein